jgi:SpoVK/Ycf46/Vps4 family AAA+-type ATPase
MTAAAVDRILEMPERDWNAANRAYLGAQLRRLRLRLRRRVLWLRHHWRHDTLQAYQGLVISEAQADWLLTGEDRSAEWEFYQRDPEASTVNAALAQAESELATWEQDGTPALEMLASSFALAPFERDVVLLCAAPDLDPAFERLFAYAQDDVNRRYATTHLAIALLCDTDEDAARARVSFLPEAPLRRLRLVMLDPAPGSPAGARPLRIDDRVSDFVRGVNRPDERITGILRPVPLGPTDPNLRELAARLAVWLASAPRAGVLPVLALTAPPDAGAWELAQAVCDRSGLRLCAIDTAQVPTVPADRHELADLLAREAALLGLAYYIDASTIDPRDRQISGALVDLVEHTAAFVVVASHDRLRVEREVLAVRLSRPSPPAQILLWRQALSVVPHSADLAVDELSLQFDFGPRAIVETVAAASAQARLRTPENPVITGDDLRTACREHAGLEVGPLAQRVDPCYGWDDAIFSAEVSSQLRDLIAQVAQRPQVYGAWGFGAVLGRGRGITALFAGPSGTGKTMAAEILANELRLDLYRIDLAGVVSKYIGETEKNLRQVFDAAERSGAILFFDEADALFGKRTEVRDSHDRYANIEVNYLLQRMEDYAGLAILATNRKAALDDAFTRRLRFVVDFPLPDARARRQIWQKVFPKAADTSGLDFGALARLDVPGGNIRNIALNAAFLAANEGVPIGMEHLMRAARREYAKMDKLLGAEEASLMSRDRP